MSTSAADTNTCSISVEPMPSISLMPVASWKACQVASGRCSPADTARRSEPSRATEPDVIIAR
jgi:hypothetical protein